MRSEVFGGMIGKSDTTFSVEDLSKEFRNRFAYAFIESMHTSMLILCSSKFPCPKDQGSRFLAWNARLMWNAFVFARTFVNIEHPHLHAQNFSDF